MAVSLSTERGKNVVGWGWPLPTIRRAAAIYTLVATAKLNDVDPRAWLANVLARIADHPARCIDELLPWNWKAAKPQARATAA